MPSQVEIWRRKKATNCHLKYLSVDISDKDVPTAAVNYYQEVNNLSVSNNHVEHVRKRGGVEGQEEYVILDREQERGCRGLGCFHISYCKCGFTVKNC